VPAGREGGGATAAVPARGVETGTPAEPSGLTLRQAMRTRSLWLFAAAMVVCGGGDFLMTTHLVPLVTDYGISTTTGANMLAWFGLLSLGGILLAGPASDRVGNKAPMAVAFGIRVLVFLLVLRFQNVVSFWILALGFGLTFLVTAPLTPTLSGRLFGFSNIGMISGFITTVHHAAGGLWAYLGGVIFDGTGGYTLAFALSAGLSAVALVCTLFIVERRHLPPPAHL
jgi:predicted MFS family arabinose efflux permease